MALFKNSLWHLWVFFCFVFFTSKEMTPLCPPEVIKRHIGEFFLFPLWLLQRDQLVFDYTKRFDTLFERFISESGWIDMVSLLAASG